MHKGISESITSKTYFSTHFGLRFVALFLSYFLLASFAWSAARGTFIERLVIEQATVATSAQIISIITPDEKVEAKGFRLISPHVRLSVLNGCEGTESIILLAAAILAFPAPWQHKTAGLFFGTGCIFILGQVRLVVLFYILRYKPLWFSAMHGYIAPTFIIIVGSLVFISWMNWTTQEKSNVLAS